MDLLTYLRAQLDDEVEPYNWSDELLLEYLKDAVIEACVRANYTSASATVDLAAGDTTCILPVGTQKIAAALYRRAGFPDQVLKLSSTYEMDRTDPNWRSFAPGVPQSLVLDTAYGSALLVAPTAYDAELLLEGQFIADFDIDKFNLENRNKWMAQTPIPISHFKDLSYWVLYQAYDRRDEDSYAPEKAMVNLQKFEAAFGRKPTAQVSEYIRRGKPVRARSYFM
jgi:hypothetical protein